jgi:hypothetical protein
LEGFLPSFFAARFCCARAEFPHCAILPKNLPQFCAKLTLALYPKMCYYNYREREVLKMADEKILVFDMDGTIADLYGVENWLEDLRAENPRPYEIAKPLYDTDTLNLVLDILKTQGWKIIITTWLAKGASKDYDRLVREAKLAWLEKMGFPYDEIHLVKYGTTKANCTRKYKGYQILVDDNADIRKGWTLGDTIDANKNIVSALVDLFEKGL